MASTRAESRSPFRNRVTVSLGPARTKRVDLPFSAAALTMGIHGEVAAHYGVEDGTYDEQATTLDYLVGSVVACLTGTFGGMLAPLGQRLGDGELTAEGEGLIENDRGVLCVRGIEVNYQLRPSPGTDLEKVERAHQRHTRFCPIARSIGGCVDITTRLVILGTAADGFAG